MKGYKYKCAHTDDQHLHIKDMRVQGKKEVVFTHLYIKLWHTHEGVCYICENAIRRWWV